MTPRLAWIAAAILLAAPLSAAAKPNPDPAALPAGDYVADEAHSSLTVKVPHGFSAYTFRFDIVDASFTYDPKTPEASKITARIPLYSMSTGYRRADILFPNFMAGAAKTATVAFTSTAIQRSSPNVGKVTGNITINGVTKPVVLDTTYNGSGAYFQDKLRLGFSATTVIKRSDFGLTQFLADVGDDLSVNIEIEFLPKT